MSDLIDCDYVYWETTMANFSAGRYADRPHRIGIKHLARVVAVHITQRNDILIGAGPDVLPGDSADTDAGYIQSVIGAERSTRSPRSPLLS